MLLSSKFEELDIRQRVLKGRYILQGYKQIDTRGKNILKTFREDNPELYSLPLQQHELRAMIGAGLKAGKNRTKMACVDEEIAYLQEMLDGELWMVQEDLERALPLDACARWLGRAHAAVPTRIFADGLPSCVAALTGTYDTWCLQTVGFPHAIFLRAFQRGYIPLNEDVLGVVFERRGYLAP